MVPTWQWINPGRNRLTHTKFHIYIHCWLDLWPTNENETLAAVNNQMGVAYLLPI